jgi:uncharacterized protein (TIGR02466 family)
VFTTLVMRTRVAGADALNRALMPEIAAIREATPNGCPAHWASRAYTTMESDNRLHRREGLSDLVAIVDGEAREFARQMALDLTDDDLRLNGCWLTVLKNGEATDVQNNPNSLLTAIYFMQAPGDGAPLLLRGPTKDLWMVIPVLEDNDLNRQVQAYNPSAGDLVMFPSSLLHNLHVHRDAQEHINLTFTLTLRSLGGG